MDTPSIWVPNDVYKKAEILLKKNTGINTRDGLELLLVNDLSFGGKTVTKGPNHADAGELMKKGLAHLGSSPYVALDVPIGTKTTEFRKAYKKLALKYHPDKNPRTTPLFQVIQCAVDKLTDPDQRAKEEKKAAASNSSYKKPEPAPAPPTTSRDAPYGANKPPPQQSSNYSYRPFPSSSETPRETPRGSNGANYSTPRETPRSTGASAGSAAYQYHQEKLKREAAAAAQAALHAAREKEKQNKAYGSMGNNKGNSNQTPRSDPSDKFEDAANVRKHREDVLREGQRAYFREQQRVRELAREKELKQKQEDELARRKAMYPNAPTDTPDMRSGNNAYMKSQQTQQEKEKNLRSFNNRAYATPFDNNNNNNDPNKYKFNNAFDQFNQQQEPPKMSEEQASYIGKTFSVRQDGSVRPVGRGGGGTTPSTNKYICPRPTGFKCTSIGSTVVELEWLKTTMPLFNGRVVTSQVELSWRSTKATRFGGADWEKASKLISVNILRKKNLIPGETYEFKIRNVSELPGGMLGDRSEWSESLVLTLAPAESASPPVPTKVPATKAPVPAYTAPKSYGPNNQEPPSNHRMPDKPFNHMPQFKMAKDLNLDTDATPIEEDDIPFVPFSPLTATKMAWQKENKFGEEVEEEDIFSRHKNYGSSDSDDEAAFDAKKASKLKSNDSFIKNTKAMAEAEKRRQEVKKQKQFEDLSEEWYELKEPPGIRNYEHPVYKEAKEGSIIVGYLIPGHSVQARSENNNWIYVKLHKAKPGTQGLVNDGWGYSSKSKKTFVYLVKEDNYDDDEYDEEYEDYNDEVDNDPVEETDHFDTNINKNKVPPLSSSGGMHDDLVDVWIEMHDEEHDSNYFYNEKTGESRWTAPEWIEEIDESSGARYYMKLNTYDATALHSTWSKPSMFSRLVRNKLSPNKPIKTTNEDIDIEDSYDFTDF